MKVTIALNLFALTGAISLPDCQIIAPEQKTLDVRTDKISVSKNPFGLAYACPNTAFVALNDTLGVLDTSTFTPSLRHEIPLPLSGAAGITIHGDSVLVSADSGIVVVDIAKAITGTDAVVNVIKGTAGSNAIEVTTFNNYAFVSQEYGPKPGVTPGNVDVLSLNGFEIGYLNLGYAVVGTALSPRGCTLYATSENTTKGTSEGSLYAIDVNTLTKDPSHALRANVSAGCSPVRVAVSSNRNVWVTARGSNHLLAFDSKLELLASVQVGTQPVGLTFVRNETRILTADSSRFDKNGTTGISVVDVQAALNGKEAVLGRIPTGKFPREFAVSPDGGTVLVSNYGSKEVQVIDVSSLP